MIKRNRIAVRPYADWCTRSIAIGLELFFTVFEFRFFEFNNDIGCIRVVFIKYNNIRPFTVIPTKGNTILQLNALCWITVIIHQNHQIQLANNFFRSQFDFFIADTAGQVIVGFTFNNFFADLSFKFSHLFGAKLRKFIVGIF